MVEVIGVYTVPENTDVSLVEVCISVTDGGFNVGDFTQEVSGLDRSSWQAPFSEVYLDPDGIPVIADTVVSITKDKAIRLAFFIFFLDLDLPLTTPFGAVPLPAKTQIPDRLNSQIKYEDPE